MTGAVLMVKLCMLKDPPMVDPLMVRKSTMTITVRNKRLTAADSSTKKDIACAAILDQFARAAEWQP